MSSQLEAHTNEEQEEQEEEQQEDPEPEPEPEPKPEYSFEQKNAIFMNTMRTMLEKVKNEVAGYDDLHLAQSVESAKVFKETAAALFNITVTEQINRMNKEAHDDVNTE